MSWVGAACFHVGVQPFEVVAQPDDMFSMRGKIAGARLETLVCGFQRGMFGEERLMLSFEVAFVRHLNNSIAPGRADLTV